MPHSFKLYCGELATPNTLTVDLSANGITVLEYVPACDKPSVPMVEDTIFLKITQSTQAALRNSLQSIQRVLSIAREFSPSVHNYTLVKFGFQPNGYAYEMFADIFDGWLEIPAGNLNNASWVTAKTITVTLHLRRQNYWIYGSTFNASITNENGTDLQYLKIYNCNDLSGTSPNKRCNYVKLDNPTAELVGDLPMPAIITLWNNYNDLTDVVRKVWIAGAPVALFPDAFTLMVEAEAAAGASATADAACSGGYKVAVALSSASEIEMFRWTGSKPWNNSFCYDRRAYHIMARFANNTSLANVKFRWKLSAGAGIELWSSEQFLLNTTTDLVQDLGVVQFPYWPAYQSYGWIDLTLTGQRTTGVTETITLDFIQLFPADNFAALNGKVDLTYDGSGSLKFGGRSDIPLLAHCENTVWQNNWSLVGANSIMLYPGVQNYLEILQQTGTSGVAEIDRTMQIGVQFLPRVLIL